VGVYGARMRYPELAPIVVIDIRWDNTTEKAMVTVHS
jgi:hypothetical protein